MARINCNSQNLNDNDTGNSNTRGHIDDPCPSLSYCWLYNLHNQSALCLLLQSHCPILYWWNNSVVPFLDRMISLKWKVELNESVKTQNICYPIRLHLLSHKIFKDKRKPNFIVTKNEGRTNPFLPAKSSKMDLFMFLKFYLKLLCSWMPSFVKIV